MSKKLSLVLSLVTLMALATPVAAAPSARGAPGESVDSSHVTTCDTITIAVDGTISVNGVALTAAQLALLSSDLLAALRLAADADANANADVCVDISASLIPLSVVVNADIAICGRVALTANAASIGGVSVPAVLLSAGLREALAVAAAADVNACLTTTVTNNSVVATVTLDACVRARLNAAGQVVVTAGGQDFLLAGFGIVGTVGPLNASAAVTIGLRIGGTLNLLTEAQTLTIQVVTISGCAASTPSSGTGPAGGTTPPGGAGAPGGDEPDAGTPLLPDTAMEARTASVHASTLALIALLLSGLLAAARVLAHRKA